MLKTLYSRTIFTIFVTNKFKKKKKQHHLPKIQLSLIEFECPLRFLTFQVPNIGNGHHLSPVSNGLLQLQLAKSDSVSNAIIPFHSNLSFCGFKTLICVHSYQNGAVLGASEQPKFPQKFWSFRVSGSPPANSKINNSILFLVNAKRYGFDDETFG